MKKTILSLFILSLIGCVDVDKFDNLKVNVNTGLPIGTYAMTSKDLVDMLELDVPDAGVVGDNVMVVSYTEKDYDVMDENIIANLVKIDDQHNPVDFDISSLTSQAPSEGENITIDDNMSDIFSAKAGVLFKEDGHPNRIIFKSAVVSITAQAVDMPTSGLYVEVPGIIKDGVPLRIAFGESRILDDTYLVNVEKEGDNNSFVKVFVKGSTRLKSTSVLKAIFNVTSMDVKYLDGYLGRKIEQNTNTFFLGDISNGFKNVDNFYPENITLNVKIDNAFEALPLLVQMTKITFINKIDATKSVSVDINNGLNVDRFFLNKGANVITIDNSITKSGTGLSDAFSKDMESVDIEYNIYTNPNDADAMGNVLQNRDNIIIVDTKINSSADIKVPLKGYMTGLAVDTILYVDFDVSELDVKKLQYNISAANTFPINLDMTLVITDKKTDEIISKEDAPIFIPGEGSLSFKQDNIRLIEGAGVDKLFSKQANLGIRLKGNTIGADKKEIVSFLHNDEALLNLFIGLQGDLYFEEKSK